MTESSPPRLRLDVTREEALERAAEIVAEAWRSFDRARPDQPPIDARIRELLSERLPAHGAPVLGVLEDAGHVLDTSLAQPRPRYFAFVGSSGLEIGVLGDLLASCYDVNLAAWAAAASELEEHAVRWVGEFVGYPAVAGAFTSGGTVSNVTALAAAREHALPGSRDTGLVGRRMAVYCSEEAHYSVDRACELLGIGAANVRSLPARREPRHAARRARGGDRRRPGAGHRSHRGRRDGRHDADRRRRPDPRARRHLRRARRVAPRRRRLRARGRQPCPRSPTSSPGSSAPAPSRSTRTSGCTCRRPAESSSCAAAPTSRRPSCTRRPTSPTSATSLTPSTSPSSTPAPSAPSSCGSRSAPTAPRRSARRSRTTCARRACSTRRCSPGRSWSRSAGRRSSRSSPSATSRPDGDLDAHNAALVEAIQQDGRIWVAPATVDGRVCLRPCLVNFRTTDDDVRALVDVAVELGAR